MSRVKIVFGSANIQRDRSFSSPELVLPLLDVISSTSITTIDTAEVYGASQEFLGIVGAGKRFTIDTKAPGGFKKGSLNTKSLIASAETSLKLLGVEKVLTYTPRYRRSITRGCTMQHW